MKTKKNLHIVPMIIGLVLVLFFASCENQLVEELPAPATLADSTVVEVIDSVAADSASPKAGESYNVHLFFVGDLVYGERKKDGFKLYFYMMYNNGSAEYLRPTGWAHFADGDSLNLKPAVFDGEESGILPNKIWQSIITTDGQKILQADTVYAYHEGGIKFAKSVIYSTEVTVQITAGGGKVDKTFNYKSPEYDL